MKENKMTLSLILDPDNIDDFLVTLNCAVRYALGRMTYMPSLVTGFIMKNCKDILDKKTITIMLNDINDCNNLGQNCDKETWMNFKAFLEDLLKNLN